MLMKAIVRFIPCRKKVYEFAIVSCAVASCLFSGCATRTQFQKGYERGAADTVKRQYWILQNMQKQEEATRSTPRVSLYRVPVEPNPNATVKTVPYEITIPIYE